MISALTEKLIALGLPVEGITSDLLPQFSSFATEEQRAETLTVIGDPAIILSCYIVARCAEVDRLAADKRMLIVGNISPAEMSSWILKKTEADAGKLDGYLFAEASARGIPILTLIDKVKAKSAQYAQLEALIAGTNGRHNDAIKALTDSAAVQAYDIQTGWPL